MSPHRGKGARGQGVAFGGRKKPMRAAVHLSADGKPTLFQISGEGGHVGAFDSKYPPNFALGDPCIRLNEKQNRCFGRAELQAGQLCREVSQHYSGSTPELVTQ